MSGDAGSSISGKMNVGIAGAGDGSCVGRRFSMARSSFSHSWHRRAPFTDRMRWQRPQMDDFITDESAPGAWFMQHGRHGPLAAPARAFLRVRPPLLDRHACGRRATSADRQRGSRRHARCARAWSRSACSSGRWGSTTRVGGSIGIITGSSASIRVVRSTQSCP
jgi:hypothetical protein